MARPRGWFEFSLPASPASDSLYCPRTGGGVCRRSEPEFASRSDRNQLTRAEPKPRSDNGWRASERVGRRVDLDLARRGRGSPFRATLTCYCEKLSYVRLARTGTDPQIQINAIVGLLHLLVSTHGAGDFMHSAGRVARAFAVLDLTCAKQRSVIRRALLCRQSSRRGSVLLSPTGSCDISTVRRAIECPSLESSFDSASETSTRRDTLPSAQPGFGRPDHCVHEASAQASLSPGRETNLELESRSAMLLSVV